MRTDKERSDMVEKTTMLWAFFLLGITAVSGKSLLTIPSLMEAGSTSQVCLVLQDKYMIEPWTIGVEEFEINVSINYVAINLTNNFELILVGPLEYHGCFDINTPDIEVTTDIEARVDVSYRSEFSAGVRNLITYKGSITCRVTPLITLIQTDKPIYKPGQTVKFRVMTMDYKLIPTMDSYSLITIESPSGLRMKQWKDVEATNGFVSLEMPLSADPVLGVWKIKVTYKDTDTEQVFTVDEYVLPKFEVTVSPPSYLLPSATDIHGKVCAKYTYGKPVKGELKLHICYESYYYYYYNSNKPRPCGDIITKIDGCYEFYLDADELQLKSRNYSIYGNLVIVANVTEEQTGIMLSGSSTGPAMTRQAMNVEIEDDSDGQFKPAFPYKARIKVTNPDGSPAPGESLYVTAHNYKSQFSWNSTFDSDDDGMIYFAINGIPKDIGTLNIKVETEDDRDSGRYLYGENEHVMYPPSAYHIIREWYSASDSFIYIPDIDEAADCDSNLPVDVYFTAEPGTDYTFLSVVRAGDNTGNSEKVHIPAADLAFILDIPADDKYTPLDKYEKPKSPEVYPEPPRPPIDPPTGGIPGIPPLPRPVPFGAESTGDGDYYDGMVPVEEELIEPVFVEPLYENTPQQRLAHFTLNLPVYSEYSPYVKVLLMYMRDDGEVVASSTEIKVNGCFKNKAKLSFAETTVRPGATVDYTVSAQQGSTCFVGMVDKSVMLLGGNNQLTPSQVFEKVQQVSRRYAYLRGSDGIQEYCKEQLDRDEPDYYYGWMSVIGSDSMTAFQDMNIAVAGDGRVRFSPCENRPMYMYSVAESMPGMTDNAGPVPLARGQQEVEAAPDTVDDVDSGSSGETEVERIRSFFPETWLWNIIPLDSTGEGEVSKTLTTTMPDTITEWVGNTVCTNPDDGTGVSDLVSVTGFQPFFVSLTLPYSAVRGETLPVVVTVFNYLSDCVPMVLRFSELEGFRFRDSGSPEREFCLCGGETETYKFYIIPTIVGEIDIEVTAVSVANTGLCTDVKLSDLGAGVSDGVQRQLLIEAEGVPEERTWSSYVCVKDGVSEARLAEWNLPLDIVPDSYRATATVVGDIMGPTLSNLKNLLRMPYGCGEQNMASWAPNIYVLQYLTNTNQLTPETEAEAENYMFTGYQRQMKYRHSDNSYSAFGENSYSNDTGSLWLTVFVVKSMAQSLEFVAIDKQDIIKSATWIVNKQDENGCFPKYGKVFSSYMKGGLADGNNMAGLTAFTLIALLEADLGDEFDAAINGGFECLERTYFLSADVYTLSVMFYAFSLRGVNDEARIIVKNILEQRRVSSNGMIHWKREDTEDTDEDSNRYIWYRAPSAEVEMTSYVLLGLLEEGRQAVDSVSPIIQWLTKQRNPYGGFSSTQDTVVALQALAKFGEYSYSGDTNVLVEIKNSNTDQTFTVVPDNNLLTQSVALTGEENRLEITATGAGCALAQVHMKYNVYKEEDSGPAFDVEIGVYRSRTDKNNCAQRTLSICAKYLKSAVSNMAIAEVKMPTGWIPVKNSLKELVKRGLVQKTEVDKNYVQLYFDELSDITTCVTFEVEQDISMNPKPALVRVYDYYETSYSVTEEYEIKTTCGTKEMIPVDNEGLDCRFVQCRDVPGPSVTKDEEPMTCPVCLEGKIDKEEITKLTCEAAHVYKAAVARQGEYSIKIMTDLRPKNKSPPPVDFSNHKIGEQCSCPILTGNTEGKALIFTVEDDTVDVNSKMVKFNDGVTVIPFLREYENRVRRLSTRKKLCTKLARLRRSGTRKSRSKLASLLRKHNL